MFELFFFRFLLHWRDELQGAYRFIYRVGFILRGTLVRQTVLEGPRKVKLMNITND